MLENWYQKLLQNFTKKELDKQIRVTKKEMEKAAKELDFIQAARLRDQINYLKLNYSKFS